MEYWHQYFNIGCHLHPPHMVAYGEVHIPGPALCIELPEIIPTKHELQVPFCV